MKKAQIPVGTMVVYKDGGVMCPMVADSEKVKMAKLGYEEKIVFKMTQDMKYPSTYKMWVKVEDKKVNENECK